MRNMVMSLLSLYASKLLWLLGGFYRPTKKYKHATLVHGQCVPIVFWLTKAANAWAS